MLRLTHLCLLAYRERSCACMFLLFLFVIRCEQLSRPAFVKREILFISCVWRLFHSCEQLSRTRISCVMLQPTSLVLLVGKFIGSNIITGFTLLYSVYCHYNPPVHLLSLALSFQCKECRHMKRTFLLNVIHSAKAVDPCHSKNCDSRSPDDAVVHKKVASPPGAV